MQEQNTKITVAYTLVDKEDTTNTTDFAFNVLKNTFKEPIDFAKTNESVSFSFLDSKFTDFKTAKKSKVQTIALQKQTMLINVDFYSKTDYQISVKYSLVEVNNPNNKQEFDKVIPGTSFKKFSQNFEIVNVTQKRKYIILSLVAKEGSTININSLLDEGTKGVFN
ncbi:hypothetical protein OF375_03025 [Ureaplasma miroungigenitalium]|uniref:hypothetical protein n=1 Tax=Ureaplasma miroungigenitalium TaxID=1042321 RepID=UPI0021E74DAE|nr:hypothetical protein [Ureaplasma miroungigenitalium]MCV3734538.1 hypothetical protein [Ureaplasma miroungigenitalium]